MTTNDGRARRWGRASLAALVSLSVIAVVDPDDASAAVVETLSVTYDDTIWGDYLLVGNSQVECISAATEDRFDADADTDTSEDLASVVDWPYATDCAVDASRNTADGNHPNDRRFMVFTRTDTTTPGIFNASDVTLTIPAGATIATARLYWHGNDLEATGVGGGTGTKLNTADTVDDTPGAAPWPSCKADSTATAYTSYGVSGGLAPDPIVTNRLRAAYDAAAAGSRTQMRLRIGAGGYQTITSQDEDLSPTDGSSGHLYQQEADVTALLAGAPTGTPVTLTGANISTGEGFGCTGAWALAVVFKYPGRNATHAPDLRRVQLYDGFVEVSNTDTVTTTLGGFLASGGGTVEPRVGVVAYEGDQQITGDSFEIEGVLLDEVRMSPTTSTNYWASTVGEFTNSTAADFTRSPNWADTAGPDMKVVPFAVGDLSGAGNGLTVTFATSGDRYTPGVLAFSALNSVVSGHVYEDADEDGQYDLGESGIAGVTLQLTGTSSSATPVSMTVTTDADGVYSFENVPVADATGYTITETHPSAYLDGADQVGTAGGADGTLAAPDSITGIQHDLTVQSVGYDFGEIVPDGDATFTKTVYAGHDSGAGCATATDSVTERPGTDLTYCFAVTNTGNSHLANVAITDAALNVPPTNPTSLSGTFPLAPAATARWYVEATAPTSTLVNTASVNADQVNAAGTALTGRPDVSGTDTATATVPPHVSIGDKVFRDLDADGIQDAGDTGVAGATVVLRETISGNAVTTDVFGDPLGSVLTDSTGAYLFSYVAPGSYELDVSPPATWESTRIDAGADDALDSDGLTGTTGVLTAGSTVTSLDVGLVQRGDVSGVVFDDLDGDGVFDGFEVGIGGVSVELSGTDLHGNSLLTSHTTASDGTFSFTNVLPGTYTLTETQPVAFSDGAEHVGTAGGSAAVNDVISGIVIGSGTSGADYRFAEIPGTIAGVVFNDLDGDGVLDSGEPGVPGVSLALSGTASRTTTTAGDGSYYFADLLAGTYTVTETQPGGYSDGIDTAGSAGGSTAVNDVISGITLSAGQAATGYHFAEFSPAQVSGSVFEDRDGDGVKDAGEPGLAGVTIAASGPTSTTTVTTSDGSFTLAGLTPGTYTITETQPTSHGDGAETVGTGGGTSSVNDVISGVVVASSGTVTGYTFAERPGSIAGVVFADDDADGTFDAGESGVGGVAVTLTGAATTVVTTASDGTFRFPNLVAGTYTVAAAQPTGLLDWTDLPGTAGGTATEPDEIGAVTLGAGVDTTGYLFSEVPPASLAGEVRVIGSSGAVAAPGVVVELDGLDDRSVPVTRSVTTGSDGGFLFDELAPGTYALRETTPAGYADGADTVGTAGGTLIEPDEISGITVTPGMNATGYRFDELLPAVGGVVFEDRNATARLEACEGCDAPTSGVEVRLLAPDTSTVATTSTASDGTYAFLDVTPGPYLVQVVAPVGTGFVAAAAGDDRTRDSDVDPVTGRVSVTVAGADPVRVDAGLLTPPVDLALDVTQSTDLPRQGDPLTYRIVVRNAGTTSAFGPITVVQTLPPAVLGQSAGGQSWTCSISGDQVTCTRTLPLLPGEAAPEISVVSTVVNASADFRTVVGVSTPATESTYGNNQAQLDNSPPRQGLVVTGAEVVRLTSAALATLAAGLGLLWAARRRTSMGTRSRR